MFSQTEMSICQIDQVWVDFADQLKMVREGRKKLVEMEAKIEREMEVKELMADSFERLLSEYKTLIK